MQTYLLPTNTDRIISTSPLTWKTEHACYLRWHAAFDYDDDDDDDDDDDGDGDDDDDVDDDDDDDDDDVVALPFEDHKSNRQRTLIACFAL